MIHLLDVSKILFIAFFSFFFVLLLTKFQSCDLLTSFVIHVVSVSIKCSP